MSDKFTSNSASSNGTPLYCEKEKVLTAFDIYCLQFHCCFANRMDHPGIFLLFSHCEPYQLDLNLDFLIFFRSIRQLLQKPKRMVKEKQSTMDDIPVLYSSGLLNILCFFKKGEEPHSNTTVWHGISSLCWSFLRFLLIQNE